MQRAFKDRFGLENWAEILYEEKVIALLIAMVASK